MPKHPHLTEEELQRLQKTVSDKGMEINVKLTDLLAGKDIELADLKGLELPKDNKEKIEKLREFLKHLSLVLKSFISGDYGQCIGCGTWIDATDLRNFPWVQYCSTCFEKIKD
jgi:RNA polymerase-binding transcription factor DksA